MEIKTSVKKAYGIELGDNLRHPVYGAMKVEGIFERTDGFDLCCTLNEFNNTMKMFDALDMIRLKYRKRTRLRIVR